MNWSGDRERVYEWMRHVLLCPTSGPGDVPSSKPLIGIKPLERCQTAILFPIVSDESGLDPADDDGDNGDDDAEDGLVAADSGKASAAAGVGRPKRRVVPPSSVGFSFFIQGGAAEIQLIPRAVRYELPAERSRSDAERWQRITLGDADSEARSLKAPCSGQAKARIDPITLFDG